MDPPGIAEGGAHSAQVTAGTGIDPPGVSMVGIVPPGVAEGAIQQRKAPEGDVHPRQVVTWYMNGHLEGPEGDAIVSPGPRECKMAPRVVQICQDAPLVVQRC